MPAKAVVAAPKETVKSLSRAKYPVLYVIAKAKYRYFAAVTSNSKKLH
jgi:hypothetical protein